MCKLTDDKGICQRLFKKPWNRFTEDVQGALGKNIVSFKQNVRVINKTTNKYQVFEKNECGTTKPYRKVIKRQEKGDSWAIRKPLHKETVLARVSLRKEKEVRLEEALKDWVHIVDKDLKNEIRKRIFMYGKFDMELIVAYFKAQKFRFRDTDISKVTIYYFDQENSASRQALDTSSNEKKIKFDEEKIKKSITDTGVRKILLNHLYAKGGKPELAFSPEGIEEMNLKIRELNDGKFHQPIYKVRVYESMGNKFPVGGTNGKKNKYVEAAKGTNLFFAIYQSEDGERQYETIPLNVAIERQKQGLRPVPENKEYKNKLYRILFELSPHDLVYVPTKEEKDFSSVDFSKLTKFQMTRMYRFVSCTGSRGYFVPNTYASPIREDEMGVNDKSERVIDFSTKESSAIMYDGDRPVLIKAHCWKLRVDRLGNITGVEG
jgi:CRISPR-associated endonuclease Csn1